MESTAAQQDKARTANPVVRSQHDAAPAVRPAGFGLPCSHCRAYYPTDMPACPICRSTERVSSNQPLAHPAVSVAAQPASRVPMDHERKHSLKELKSQASASDTQINTAATSRCVLQHQHKGTSEPAAVCHTCYRETRQLADRLEAALHMDAKEAARIVYEAVWADTSDPNQTYQNAAAALLSELRKRAGIGLLLGSHQPLTH